MDANDKIIFIESNIKDIWNLKSRKYNIIYNHVKDMYKKNREWFHLDTNTSTQNIITQTRVCEISFSPFFLCVTTST